jgi:hypothetical protein
MILCGSQNRQPYTILADWFCIRWSKSLYAPDYDTESLSIVQNVPRQSPDIDTPNCFLEDRQGQGDTRLTLSPSVIPNSNYVIMVSDWNFLKCFCVFFCSVIRRTKTFLSHCITVVESVYCAVRSESLLKTLRLVGLKAKIYVNCLKIQSVPRSKRTSSRLYKPVVYCKE